ncbi:hypothetical protein JXQ70_20000 [bacterium]|nr:hypothetical protein [bacterium]
MNNRSTSRKPLPGQFFIPLVSLLVLAALMYWMQQSCTGPSSRRPTSAIPIEQLQDQPLGQSSPNDCAMVLNNRLYTPGLVGLIDQARSRIDLILYQLRYYAAHPESASNTLLYRLAQASARGVRVRLIVEASDWNPENSLQNRRVATLLSNSGVEVRFDRPNQNSHNKLIVIDQNIVVIGSTNWSYYSLERNNETSLALRSTRIAHHYQEYFERLFAQTTDTYPLHYPVITSARLDDHTGPVVVVTGQLTTFEPLHSHSNDYALTLDFSSDIIVPVSVCEEIWTVWPDFPRCLSGQNVTAVLARSSNAPNAAWTLIRLDALEDDLNKQFMLKREVQVTSSDTTPVPLWENCIQTVACKPLDNDVYLPHILDLIKRARSGIKIMQIECYYYDQEAWPTPNLEPATNRILDQLVAASQRGVRIELLTDIRGTEAFSTRKKAFLDQCNRNQITVFLDDPDLTTHSKSLIIDDRFVIIGSTNWSLPALTENNESSILVDSPDLARIYSRFFDQAIQVHYPNDPKDTR